MEGEKKKTSFGRISKRIEEIDGIDGSNIAYIGYQVTAYELFFV